jgi:hypothetical protein
MRTENKMAATQHPGTKANPGPVDPNMPEGGEGAVTTLDGLFEQPIVVDEIVEAPMASNEPDGGWWIVRLNTDIEHMSVGTIDNSFSFESGRRYKVPLEVMSILAHRDYLLEIPQRVN